MGNDLLQRLLYIEELKQLKARYWRYLDTKDWKAWGGLLADDFHFEVDGHVFDGGRDVALGISQALADAVTVHQGHVSEITITGPETAAGIWSFSDWVEHPARDGGPPSGFKGHGHYHDEYVRTADGWKITRSVVTRLRVDVLEGGRPTLDDRHFSRQ